MRTASEVGNYDYLIDYRFRQNGEIYIKIGATGLDAVKGVASTSMDDATAATDTAYGTLVASNLVAPFHDHYFNFRLDFEHRRPLQPSRHPGNRGRRAGIGQSEALILEGQTLGADLRTGCALHLERDGAEILSHDEQGGTHHTGPPPRLHDSSRQRRIRSVRLRRRPADEAQRLHRTYDLEYRP